ncbi:MAG: adenylosuccinate synthetase, partial [Flavisolibacter sp.]
GWKVESSLIKEAKSLPEAMKSYIAFINENLSAKVHYISNGPGRDQIVNI